MLSCAVKCNDETAVDADDESEEATYYHLDRYLQEQISSRGQSWAQEDATYVWSRLVFYDACRRSKLGKPRYMRVHTLPKPKIDFNSMNLKRWYAESLFMSGELRDKKPVFLATYIIMLWNLLMYFCRWMYATLCLVILMHWEYNFNLL